MEIYYDRNVYIVGAGFSADAGIPLVKDFMRKLRDGLRWLRVNGRESEVSAVERVLNFRSKAASAVELVSLDLEDIEELFSLASAASSGNIARDVPLAIAATLDYALHDKKDAPTYLTNLLRGCDVPKSWKDWEDPGPRSRFWIPLYEAYMLVVAGYPLDRNPDRRDTIISFNYDSLIDDALRNLKIPFSYGLSTDDADFLTAEVCRPEPVTEDTIRVLKLHGSVNWARPSEGSEKLSIYDSYDEVRKKGQSPFLAPPTWRKILGGQLSVVWDKAVDSLQTATRLFVIGYSIPPTDQHFKYLLAAGLQGNISLRDVVFVNLGLKSEEEKLKLRNRLFTTLRPELEPKRVQLKEQSATQFLLGDGADLMNRRITTRLTG
jgi:SIR2-like protein